MTAAEGGLGCGRALLPLPAYPAARAGVWTVAALVVVVAHAGAFLWLMRETDAPIATPEAAPAIMMDLAPVAEAVVTDRDSISDQTQDSQEVRSEPVPVPDETAEPLPEAPAPVFEPLPAPELAEEPPPPVEAEVALPEARPQRRPDDLQKPEKPEPKKRQKPRKAAPPPSQAANRAAAQVAQSQRNAAPKPVESRGTANRAAVADWRGKLMTYLERRKRYPASARMRGEEGVVKVSFTIDTAGNVLSAEIVGFSGSADLDRETLAMIRRASPVPAPPPGVPLTIVAPIRYTLR